MLGGACVRCGAVEQLEFDHIDPATKSFNLSIGWSRSWDTIVAELGKCQLLCHDCHKAKSDAEQTGDRSHGSLQRYKRGKCRCPECRATWNEWRREYRLRTGKTKRSYGPRAG